MINDLSGERRSSPYTTASNSLRTACIEPYMRRFVRRFCSDSWAWIRDNVLLAALGATSPIFLVLLPAIRRPFDRPIFVVVLLFYSVELATYLFIHALKTVNGLDKELRYIIAKNEMASDTGKPNIGLRVVNQSPKPSRGQLYTPFDVRFILCHLGGRPATNICFASTTSPLQELELRLINPSYIATQSEFQVDYEIRVSDSRRQRFVDEALGRSELLKQFIEDYKGEGFLVRMSFEANHDSFEQVFQVRFDLDTYTFSTRTEQAHRLGN